MNFKLFPCNGKFPVKGMTEWGSKATADPETLLLWQNLYRERLTHWGLPTGPINGILVLDVDMKGNGFETLKTLSTPETMSQRTPSGGMHLVYKYPDDGRHYGNRVQFMPGLDTRGAGGYIIHYGLDNKPIVDAPQWLLDAALNLPEPIRSGPTIAVSPEIALGIVQESLDAIREAADGESNNTLNVHAFKLGQLVASGSITRDYAEQALYKAAIERGKPAYEAKATIRSGLDGGLKKPVVDPFGAQAPTPLISMSGCEPQARWTPAPFTHQDLLNTSKLRKPQLFENWSTEDIHISTADGGTGKTTMKLFESICLALGERFLGFRCVQPGKTLFITGEDTDKKLGAMIGQILKQMGLLEDPQYNDKVRTVLDSILVKKDADLCLIVKERHSGFLVPSGDAMRKLLEAVEDLKPKMIVFDPISSFWGSENALNDMNKAVTKFMAELAERSGACVEMINHMGKQSSNQKDMTQFAGRGGTGLPSNSRVSRALRSVFDKEYQDLTGETLTEKQSAMLCNVNKFTDGSPLYNKPFLILRDGHLFTRKHMTDAKAKEAEESLSDTERVFQFIKEARSTDRWPTTKVVVAHFVMCGSPIQETRIRRAITTLEFHGHMGEKIKLVENPDQTCKERVYVITDMEGKET